LSPARVALTSFFMLALRRAGITVCPLFEAAALVDVLRLCIHVRC
jgi:hypothetical protein